MNKTLNIKRVGITGGIGAGKTEAGKFLEKSGEKVLYADIIAKEQINNNEKVKSKIKKLFGQSCFDPAGKLDNKKLADIVFDDEESLMLLNSIVHPEVFKVIDAEAQKTAATVNRK